MMNPTQRLVHSRCLIDAEHMQSPHLPLPRALDPKPTLLRGYLACGRSGPSPATTRVPSTTPCRMAPGP